MNNNNEQIIEEKKVPTGEFVELDNEEVRFKALVDLYLEGKLTYKELMELYPHYSSSMFAKLARLFIKKTD